MAKNRGFVRTWFGKFVDIFRRGIPQLIRLLRIPQLIQLVKTRLRLKLIVFFWVSVAAAFILGSFSGLLSSRFDSPRYNTVPNDYYDFRVNVDEIAQRITSRNLSIQDLVKVQGLLNSNAKYASERYYLVREDGSVVAKSSGAEETRLDVYSILQQRLQREPSEVLEEFPDRVYSDNPDAEADQSGTGLPVVPAPQQVTPIQPQAELGNQSGTSQEQSQTSGNVTTGGTIQPETGQSVTVTPGKGDQSPQQTKPNRIAPENRKPRYVYLVPVRQNDFRGYVVGYINQENYHPMPFNVKTNSESYWFNEMVIGIGTFFFMFFYLTKNTLKTIEDISTTSRKIAKGDFQVRVTKHTEDELGELAEHINQMVEELEESIDKERRARLARDELITSASHDLRTPLTSMMGYLELLRNDRRSEQEKSRFIEIAYKKTQRLKSLVDDLFEFTKSSSGDLQLNKKPIDLCELFGQLLAEFEPMLEQEGMTPELECQGEIIVSVDPEKMVRVFENLVTNAIRYGKEGKKLLVKVVRDEKSVAVSVTNFGQAIPAQDLDKIFDRFYRVEKSRSEQTGGSGLGLAIAKNLVERHGGTIAVSSNEQNTTFTVKLPLDLKSAGNKG